MERPKVFLSYSWSSIEHEDFVLNLAERLVDDNIDVVFDKWDLSEGQDVYHFMEQSIKEPTIKHVLLICDKTYKEKADARKQGTGVSTEAQIISTEVYHSVDSKKFIAVLAGEFDKSSEVLPTFVQTRKYVDLSKPSSFEDNYEILLRAILDKPLHKKPPFGKTPDYIQNESPQDSKLSKHLNLLEHAYSTNNNYKIISAKKSFTDDYVQEVQNKLANCLFPSDSIQQTRNLHEMLTNTDKFSKHFRKISEIIVQYEVSADIRFWKTLFQNLLTAGEKNREFEDVFKFIIVENYLFLIGHLIDQERFDLLDSALSITLESISELKNHEIIALSSLWFYSELIEKSFRTSIDSFKKTICITADILISNSKTWNGSKLLSEADLFLFYFSVFQLKLTDADSSAYAPYGDIWFAKLYIYNLVDRHNISWMLKLKSKKYFDKINSILGPDNLDSFKAQYISTVKKSKLFTNFSGTFSSIPKLDETISLDDICTVK